MTYRLLGRPNPSWKRSQVAFLVLFWLCQLRGGNPSGPKFSMIRKLNRLWKNLSPWQIVVTFYTLLYLGRNVEVLLPGLAGPEPLAYLYSPSYYLATSLITGLDAGFATAMNIRPKWLRDFFSIVFSIYYMLHVDSAEEKLRKYRAVCTVEFLKVTWEKTANPYLRLITFWKRPSIHILRQIPIKCSLAGENEKSVMGWLFFDGSELELFQSRDLVLDIPGGGFVCMTPQHHEERLRSWAVRCKRPVFSLDYAKAPEHPYPYAINQCFSVYCELVKSNGRILGMSGVTNINIILSGDSAGANLVTGVMFKILEHHEPILHPIALVLAYPAFDFNLTSWMSPEMLNVFKREQSTTDLSGLAQQKDHYTKDGPLATIKKPGSSVGKQKMGLEVAFGDSFHPDEDSTYDLNDSYETKRLWKKEKPVIQTRLTMTSRTGYFQDRIISPGMMRAMAILYIGPNTNPDFATDYRISPVLAPNELLAQFPPILLTCGEKDPLVDDSVIFAGRIREAKRLCRGGQKQQLMNGRRSHINKQNLRGDREDSVTLAIIEGWSHGYLQMSAILPKAQDVINWMGDWIGEMFRTEEKGLSLDGNPVILNVDLPSGAEAEEKRRNEGVENEERWTTNIVTETRSWAQFTSRGSERVAGLVSEADLLKRRREEVVFGIGNFRTGRSTAGCMDEAMSVL